MPVVIKLANEDVIPLMAIVNRRVPNLAQDRSLRVVHDSEGTLTVDDALAPVVKEILAVPDWKTYGSKQDLRDYAASVRFQRETAGIGTQLGFVMPTDRDTQQRLFALAVLAGNNRALSFHWKLPSGRFVELSAAAVVSLSQTITMHVQSCFKAEARVLAAIDNSTITTNAQIDAAFQRM